MRFKRTGKFWLVVAGPLALPIGAALVVLALSTVGERMARSQAGVAQAGVAQAAAAQAAASDRARTVSGPPAPPGPAVVRARARVAERPRVN